MSWPDTTMDVSVRQSLMCEDVLQEVGFKDAFWPLYGIDAAEPVTLTNIALRASFALLAAGISWLLYANSPDKGMAPHITLRSLLCLARANLCWSLLFLVSGQKLYNTLLILMRCDLLAGQVGDGARKARDSILDMLNLHDPAQLKLGSNNANQTFKGSASSHVRPDLQDINPRI